MQLIKYRISADDAEVFNACAGWRSLRAQNHPQGILLSGLPLYLDEPGRAYDWAALASVLSGKRSRTRLTRFPDWLLAAELPLPTSLAILSKTKLQRSGRTRRGERANLELIVSHNEQQSAAKLRRAEADIVRIEQSNGCLFCYWP